MRKRIHLIENFAKDWNDGVLPLKEIKLEEGNKFVEADGKSYAVTRGFSVPVWRLGVKNLNGRYYGQKLGEMVVKDNKKTINLADHPKDEGSVRDIIAVSMNPHIEEGVLYVDSYFVDEEFEKKVERMIEKGVGLGVSSSAYGELDKGGNVMEESFELERYWDAVVSPSFEVFITKEAKNEELIDNRDTNKIEEEKPKESNQIPLEEQRSMAQEENVKTSKPSLEERNLIRGVRSLLKEAQAIEDLYDKRKAYEEILEYCDGVDIASEFIEKANTEINKVDEELKSLADKGKETDSLKESKETLESQIKEKDETIEKLTKELEEVTEKFELAASMLDESKDRDKKLKEMYQIAVAERNGMVKASEYRELYSYVQQMEEEKENLAKELRELKRRKTYVEEEEEVEEEETSEELNEEEDSERGEYNFRNNQSIREYYNDLVEENPEVKRIKNYILNSKTLMEAQNTYLKFKDLVEDIPSPGKRRFEIRNEKTGKTEPVVFEEEEKSYGEGSLIERVLKKRNGYR